MAGTKIMVATLWFLGLVICGGHLASAQRRTLSAQRRSEQDVLNSILDPNTYDSQTIPGGNETGNGPTYVEVNFFVRDMSVEDDTHGELKVQLTLRQRWNDPRLSYTRPNNDDNRKYVTLLDMKKVWTPDLFVANEKEAKRHDYSQSNSYIRIFPNGDVLKSERVSLSISCPMNYQKFPFDTQTCSIKVASYAYTNQDILFTWKPELPIQIKHDLALKNFKLTGFITESCDSTTTTGTYSCLRSDFTLQRELSYYGVQVFIPCLMLIIVAWLAFWMAPKDIIPRVILGAGTLFVLAIGTSLLNQTLPKVSYTKAIDIFTGISLTFVFATLIETIVVYYWARQESENGENGAAKEDGAGATDDDVETQALKSETDGEKGASEPKKLSPVQKYAKRYWTRIDQQSCSQKTDIVFRIVYPLVFILFALIYFVVYCSI